MNKVKLQQNVLNVRPVSQSHLEAIANVGTEIKRI